MQNFLPIHLYTVYEIVDNTDIAQTAVREKRVAGVLRKEENNKWKQRLIFMT